MTFLTALGWALLAMVVALLAGGVVGGIIWIGQRHPRISYALVVVTVWLLLGWAIWTDHQ